MQRLQHYERPFVANAELIDDRGKRLRGLGHRRRRDAGFAVCVLRGGGSGHRVLIVDHRAVGVLVATNRIFGLVTASQIASASTVSFLWRLTYGFT
jgi:hypothetical protein